MHEETRTQPAALGGVDIDADEEALERGGPWWKRALRIVLPLLVLLAGALVVWLLFFTAPEPVREPPAFEGAVVEVARATSLDGARPTLDVLGAVTPARQVEVVPQVAGNVEWVAPALVPGGFFREGAPMIRIDPAEYRLAIAAQDAEIAEARLALARQPAERTVAERTRALFPEDVAAATPEGRELARREPQVRSAEQRLEAAQSQLERARLDLERTSIAAPFDGVVVSERVDPGQRVSPQQAIATLAGVGAYHVEVSVPVSALSSLRAAGPAGGGGSPALVRTSTRDGERVWSAYVGPLAPRVTERGSMAQLIVVVPDPLGLAGDPGARDAPLLLGALVEVELRAEPIEGAVAVPRAALRDGDEVWIATDAGTLEIRDVEVAWTEADRALLAEGVSPGERVIVSRIGAPVEGMRVRVAEDEAEAERRLQASLGARRAR